MSSILQQLLLKLSASNLSKEQKALLADSFSKMNQATLLRILTLSTQDKDFLGHLVNVTEQLSKEKEPSVDKIIGVIENELENV